MVLCVYSYPAPVFLLAGTRETAFLNAIICAGIAREVARQCKMQTLDSCACSFAVAPSNDNGITIISGCGDNCVYGIKISREFCDTGLDKVTCTGLAARRNNAVGRKVCEYRLYNYCRALSISINHLRSHTRKLFLQTHLIMLDTLQLLWCV